MKMTFLGTSSMVPTKKRSHNSMLLTYKDHGILIDCGEGTQRQMKYAGIKPSKITMILLTHWHGDHVLGLPGLIQTLGASEYSGKLSVYGPPGSKIHFEHLKKAFVFEEKIDMDVQEVKSGLFFEDDDLQISAEIMDHTTPCLGFSIKERDSRKFEADLLEKHGIKSGPHFKDLEAGKTIVWNGKTIKAQDVSHEKIGRKITIIMDTRYCKQSVELAKGADLLISEATFTKDMQDKARRYKHMTASDAANLAKEANVKKLVLTHFSQRYKESETAKKEAKEVFDDVVCAEDFMTINV